QVLVKACRLADLRADGQHRVKRGHRLLEDHRDVVAAHRPHLRFVELEQIAAIEFDRAADDPAGRIGDEPHHGERRHALAAAGFADDRQRLTRSQREREVVDCLDDSEPGKEICPQPCDVENGPSRAFLGTCPSLGCRFVDARPIHQLRCLGSRMSRSASPRRFVPNTARLMAIPGKMTSHGAVRTYSAADCDNMRPQEGNGSGTPRPRNDSAASVRIVEPSWAVASTINGARVLGKMCRAAMRSSLMPTAFAASTKGSSRNASVLERMTRAT